MDECLEIVYQAGFLYKHKEIYGNEELEVLERAKDLKRMNYSLFENCELNKSFLFYKVCEVLEKKNNQMDLLSTGWLNTILGKKEKGIQKELEFDDWDDCYLSYEYTFLSIVEVYCMTHTRKQLDVFLEDVSIEMLYQLQGIELMIKEYQSHCKEIQYENLKNILVDLFSDGLHKVEMEYPEEVYEIIRNCLELKSFILPFYLLCFCYQKDFNKEWKAVKNLIDRNYLKEEIEIIPYISTKDYFQLEEGKDLYYKENIKELPLGFQQYFKNLYEEYQRISITSSLYNKQRIFSVFKKMEIQYQLYPMKEFVDDFYLFCNKEKYCLMKVLEQVLDDCLKQEYGKATVEITLSLIMNQKLRLAVFGF